MPHAARVMRGAAAPAAAAAAPSPTRTLRSRARKSLASVDRVQSDDQGGRPAEICRRRTSGCSAGKG